jgi:hypothetical protein
MRGSCRQVRQESKVRHGRAGKQRQRQCEGRSCHHNTQPAWPRPHITPPLAAQPPNTPSHSQWAGTHLHAVLDQLDRLQGGNGLLLLVIAADVVAAAVRQQGQGPGIWCCVNASPGGQGAGMRCCAILVQGGRGQDCGVVQCNVVLCCVGSARGELHLVQGGAGMQANWE